ncbi:maleylpyruvate isomerase family mycothiol-dependent enzyme [Nocardioides zeicaulis]|uniref:Maleylpyruvate isomerase family mycothiol-dependent enzyme n=1 Tax=Nocardioides zeicaulis TaxID=1776857 RepID=A0ABV6DW99_9ACTN
MTGVTDTSHRVTGLLRAADHALVRTVDGLDTAAYAEPSLLPGWTRAHVLAHLALNAEALAGALHGAHVGRPQPMYASQEARDGDIDELAARDPAELRERLMAGTATFEQALAAMGDGDWAGTFERTPGGRVVQAAAVPLMRLREVEIHHADLGAGHTHAAWSAEFCAVLLDSLTAVEHPTPLTVRPTDLDGEWRYGPDGEGPVVSGTAADLAWWLTGRGAGESLTSSTNEIPEMEAW